MTEQRHPKTWNLSQVLASNTAEGLRQILSVDQDISEKFALIANRKGSEDILSRMESASRAIERALITPGRKVYIYGCGSTGRLAKEIESETWKQFWRRNPALASKVESSLGDKMADKIIGELTGGDRALVNALEGFEDLLVIGDL